MNPTTTDVQILFQGGNFCMMLINGVHFQRTMVANAAPVWFETRDNVEHVIGDSTRIGELEKIYKNTRK